MNRKKSIYKINAIYYLFLVLNHETIQVFTFYKQNIEKLK